MTRHVRTLALGLAIGLLLGYAVGAASATPRSESDVGPEQTGAPRVALPGETDARERPAAGPSLVGAPPPSSSPAVASVRPTATVASEPGTPLPSVAVTSTGTPGAAVTLTGRASWYCLPGRSACTAGYPASGLFAAAGPALRRALGPDWRGTTVLVCRKSTCIRATLSDWCQCHRGTSSERLIDLYASIFRKLAPLSRGVVRVTVTW